MVTEDYVSFETSKLLKEKGFDEPVMYNFTPDGTKRKFQQPFYKDDVAQPTLQMALKWIREQGFYINIDIDVDYDEDERGTKWYYKPAWDWVVFRIDERKQMSDDGALYASYEQAAEAAIKYCLESLI